MDSTVNYNRLNRHSSGTDKNVIGKVKHHRAGTARADNGLVVYKKVGKIAKTC